jgi:hypothetical protein
MCIGCPYEDCKNILKFDNQKPKIEGQKTHGQKDYNLQNTTEKTNDRATQPH